MGNNNTEIKKQNSVLVDNEVREPKHFNWHIDFGSKMERILFARTLSTILNSGINIVDALRIIEAQSVGQFKIIVYKIRKDVEGGSTLASTLAKYPKYFNQVYVGLVNVGEKSGSLIEGLNYIAEQQEKDLELTRKVQSASLYPIIIFSFLIILTGLLSYYILPQLVTVFSSFDLQLPWTTRLFLSVALIISKHGLVIFISVIVAIALGVYIVKTKIIRPYYWQVVILRLPVFGKIVEKLNLARFCRILGTFLKSGVPISEGVNITLESLSNEVYKKQLKKIKFRVLAGLSLGEAIENLHKPALFPKVVSQMISVGERTGTLEKNLIYLAEFYEKEVDNITKNLASIIEPVLLIIVGLAVALIAIAIISPIYEFVSSLSHSL
jgi:type IV pilus assembly protein PilC